MSELASDTPRSPEKTRAFLYCRKSSESEEAQKYSIPAQEAEMRKRAADLGLSIVRVFRESQSARKTGRPVFAEMMDLVYDGGCDVLLCWQPDRLSRNGKDAGTIIYALEEGLIDRIITHDKVFAHGGMDRMVLNMEFGASRIASDDMIIKTQRGVRQKVERGEAPGCPPWGYLNAKESKKHGIVIPDERAWPYVRRVWDMALSGSLTLSQIAAATAEFPTDALGKKGFSGKPMSVSGIQQILTNPFYYGFFRWGGKLNPGVHKKMVTKAEFDRVQRILRDRQANGPRTQKKKVGIPGTFSCARCGRRMSPYEKLKEGRRYVYYRCSRRHCPQRPISEPILMEQLLPMLKRAAITPEERDACIALLHERNADEFAFQQQGVADAERELRNLAEHRARVLDLFAVGKIRQADYDRQMERFDQQEKILGDAKAQAATRNDGWCELAERFLEGLTNANNSFAALPDHERGAFLRGIECEPVVADRKLHLDAKCLPLQLLNRGRHPRVQALADAVRTHFAELGASATASGRR